MKDILFNIGGYYITNKGTKKEPIYYVWIPGVTHSTCIDTFKDYSIAVDYCKYLFKNKIKI